MRLLQVASIAVFAVFALQLLRLQILDGARYRALAARAQVRALPIEAARGVITDRTGIVLARNRPQYAIELVPAELPSATAARAAILDVLGRLTGNHPASLDAAAEQGMRSRDPFAPIRLRSGLDTTAAIEARAALADMPGTRVVASALRVYEPGSELLPHVLGSVGPIQPSQVETLRAQGYALNAVIGQGGVEATYEAQLRGAAGMQQIAADPVGRELARLGSTPAHPGSDVVLAIDLGLQRAATDALRDGIAKGIPPGGRDADGKPALAAGAVVVMDVRSGELRALVSLPSYEANVFGTQGDPRAVASLLADPARPLLDRAYMEVHSPGSVFKPIVGVAALQESIATPQTRITSTGAITVTSEYDSSVQYVFRDWAAHGTLDFNGAIARSSDVYFYELAGGYREFAGLGADRIARYARAFGLGATTGLDLPSEAAGLVPDPAWKRRTIGDAWVLGDTYTFGIGQGYLTATPLQMAVATAAIANGGEVLQPRVVAITRGLDGAHPTARVVRGRVPADPQHLAQVRTAMLAAASEGGTAADGRPARLSIGAKTGTAEFGTRLADGSYDSHGWFIAFAPYEQPEVAVVVYLEHGVGATHAGPVARRILESYFAARGPEGREARP